MKLIRINALVILAGCIMILLATIPVQAAVIQAASASRDDVAAAISAATYGDTVRIPACDPGSCIWPNGIDITRDIRIIGAGVDQTFLTLGFAGTIAEEALFKFVPDSVSRDHLDSLNDVNTFEVSGITFDGVDRKTNKFSVWVSNYNLPSIRRIMIHHNRFISVHRAVQVKGYVHGVFCDNTLTNTNASYPQGAGYQSFLYDRMRPGSGDGWYIEDNKFLFTDNYNGMVSGAANDGGGHVIRYNTVTGEMSGGANYFETHGNQLSGIYGPQLTEVYGNKFAATGLAKGVVFRGGKGIFLANVFSNETIQIWEEYSDTATSGTNPTGRCNEPGQGVGRQNCTDDCICQKVHDAYFINNRLMTATGPLIPAYVAMDFENRSNNIVNDPPEEVENIEFFNHVIPFTGASGAGAGPLAAIPATAAPGVGYWATDQSVTDLSDQVGAYPATPISGVLYKWSALENKWIDWYRPYTYPHPMRHVGQTIPFNSGWNWISFNVLPNDRSLNSAFASILTNVEQVRTQTQSALRLNGQWVGDLLNMDGIQTGKMYKVRVTTACTLTVTGTPIAANTPISLQIGWNWSSFYPSTLQPLNEALISITGQVQQVRSQTQSAIYLNGQWIGDLTQMEPGKGYTIRMSGPGTLTYPGGQLR